MRPIQPLSAVRAGAYLHHLRLGSEDPAKLADFYAAAMDMRVEPLADGSTNRGVEPFFRGKYRQLINKNP